MNELYDDWTAVELRIDPNEPDNEQQCHVNMEVLDQRDIWKSIDEIIPSPPMPVGRRADPTCVQHVWDAIRFANSQRQTADLSRIVKYLQKMRDWSQTQAELYIQQTLDDGLIVAVNKVNAKGSASGNAVESYRIPFQELDAPRNEHRDWYCIECHLAGDVSACTSCYRVFHAECSTKAKQKMSEFKKRASDETTKTTEPNKVMTPSQNVDDNKTPTTNTENGTDLVDLELSFESLQSCLNQTAAALVEESQQMNDVSNSGSRRMFVYDESLCSICNLTIFDIECGLEREELNHLLGFLLLRIKSWVPENITDCMAPEPNQEWLTPEEKVWRANQLFQTMMDMVMIERKLKSKEYTRLCDFYADVLQTSHNIGIYHGTGSQEYGAADLMLRDCKHDINELRNCVDCYKYSNEKINNKWFCLPCRVPHRLVWAKQKGYPYWPAKVILETEASCDVRFFGGKYERSILPKNCIKPISTNLESLHIKRSSAFNRAYQELLLHQKVLNDPIELNKLLCVRVKRRNPTARRLSVPSGRKNNKLVKTPTTPVANNKKLNKTFGGTTKVDDIFDFNDSVADFESFHLQRTYAPKRRTERSQSMTSTKRIKSEQELMKIERIDNRPSNRSADVINISDGEEEEEEDEEDEEDEEEENESSTNQQQPQEDEYSEPSHSLDNSQELVTSSTECFNTQNCEMQQLEHPYSDAVEKMRRKLEATAEKKDLIKIAMDCMQSEIDKISSDHNDHLRKLFEAHNQQLSETKKKQWCYNCEQDAIYHCCWNTAYCSTTCQQQHWQAEHKKVCRRKR